MRPSVALQDVKNFLGAVTWDRRRRDLDLQDPGVALLHSALTAPASAAELSGETDAVTLFRTSSAGRSVHARRLWRPAVLSSLSSLLGTKLATALAVGAVGLGGAATVAYTGNLPEPLQNAAHDTIGAPAVHPSDQVSPEATDSPKATPTATPVGPDAKGSAAYGLCTAFNRTRTHGKVAEKSVAYRNLATAAGGAANIAAYCATVVKPGQTPSPEATSSPEATHGPGSHPTGKPATLPAHPTGEPASPGAPHRP